MTTESEILASFEPVAAEIAKARTSLGQAQQLVYKRKGALSAARYRYNRLRLQAFREILAHQGLFWCVHGFGHIAPLADQQLISEDGPFRNCDEKLITLIKPFCLECMRSQHSHGKTVYEVEPNAEGYRIFYRSRWIDLDGDCELTEIHFYSKEITDLGIPRYLES